MSGPPADPRAGGFELVCLPPAGGSVASFRAWSRAAPPGVGVRTLARTAESRRRATSLLDQARTLARTLAATSTDRGYVLAGHSLGGLLAYETVRELVERSAPLPAAVVVLGTRPPHLSSADFFAPVVELGEEQLLAALTLMGVVNAQLRDSPLRSLFLPGLRADLRLIAGYRPRLLPPLPVDLYAWHGSEDALAPPDLGSGWSRYTTGRFGRRTFEGDHFFPVQSATVMVQALVGLGRDVGRRQHQAAAG